MRFEPRSAVQSEEPADSAPSQSEKVVEEEPKKMRGGREAKSLAEEMFEEMAATESEPPGPEPMAAEPVEVQEPIAASFVEEMKPEAEPTPAELMIEAVAEPEEPEPVVEQVETVEEEPEAEGVEALIETHEGFRPNPNLPKPVKKKSRSSRSFMLVGGLMILVLVGMAVTSPLRHPKPLPSVEINVANITENKDAARKQLTEVQNYRTQVLDIMDASDKEASALSVAVHSGKGAVTSAAGKNLSYKAWQQIRKLKVPPGLAGAKENLVLGLFTRKNAVANALSVGQVDASNVNARLSESTVLIKKGLESIDNMEADLNKQLYGTPEKTEKSK